MLRASIIVLVTIFSLVNGLENYPKVKTPYGKIRGYYKRSANNKTYKAFEGIPFAAPPVEQLRFEAPRKIRPWVGELQATKLQNRCTDLLVRPVKDDTVGFEDCLYLNIYVPFNVLPIPVIIWFFGGTSGFGAGSDVGAKYLIDKNIIFVTFNHRLGPFGFLSTEDDVVSGNMGLKDQSMAIRWINKNIKYFGGDPKKITLLGFSSGASSVHFHYLSPLSAGLFQNGISVSGTALSSWAIIEKSLEKANVLGALMSCPTNTTKDMIECLRRRPYHSILEATSQVMVLFGNPFVLYGPVVEKSQTKYFINRSPEEIIAKGDAQDIPWITSNVSDEGIFPAIVYATNDTRLKDLNDNWEKIAPSLLDYNYTIPQNLHTQVARRIRKHYFGSQSINNQTIKALIQMLTNRIYISTSEKATRLQAKHNKSPLWYYYYSFKASASLSESLSGSKENFGAAHGDDVYLVLEQSLIKYNNTIQDQAMREYLLNLYTSVAKNGFPENNGAKSEEMGERFHQDIKQKERHYQGRWDERMMADYCWSLKRHDAFAEHRRQSHNRSFEVKRQRFHKEK